MYVFYPHGGEHYLLTHWTHNEQTHIVLGRTPESCLAVVKSSKFVGVEIPQIRGFDRITIVRPTQEYEDEVRELTALKEEEEFATFTASQAQEFWRISGVYPPGFTKCPNPPEDGDDDPSPYHYSCTDCQMGVQADPEVYRRLYQAALKAPVRIRDHWRLGTPGKGQVHSRAPYADPSRTLYRMMYNPGHHHSGTEEELATPSWGSWQWCNFYYHKEEPCPDWLSKARKLRDLERNRQRREELSVFFGIKE